MRVCITNQQTGKIVYELGRIHGTMMPDVHAHGSFSAIFKLEIAPGYQTVPTVTLLTANELLVLRDVFVQAIK